MIPEEITSIIRRSKPDDIQSKRKAAVELVLKTFSGTMRNVYCLDHEDGAMLVLTTEGEDEDERIFWKIQTDDLDKLIKRILTTSQVGVFKRGVNMALYRSCDTSKLSTFMFNVALEQIPPDLTGKQRREFQKAIEGTRMDIRKGMAVPAKYINAI
jgi:hypothetical protein